jgi:hypothetical protein
MEEETKALKTENTLLKKLLEDYQREKFAYQDALFAVLEARTLANAKTIASTALTGKKGS